MKKIVNFLFGTAVILGCNVMVGCGNRASKSAVETQSKVDTIRVLAIGNSFSEDGVENHLSDIAQAAGYKIVIGNMVIGGCSLERHCRNIDSGEGAYSYRKFAPDGVKQVTEKTPLLLGIKDEPWDFISMQQVSGNSGIFDSYLPYLPKLHAFVNENKTNGSAELMWHQTWAYAQNSTHSDFPKYDRDQLKMYNAIVETAWRGADLVGMKTVVPSGTAIQNGRTSFVGDNFCRDGYHLDLAIGRYTAACTWFTVVTGESPVGNTYRPEGLTDREIAAAQHAAHYAVMNPKKVTEMVDFR